jgi:DNA-directed RNA polymerase specialized sigma24 family protein
VVADASSQTDQLQALLERTRGGDRSARDELFRRAAGRLERLTRRMLRGFPGVRRWAQTDDVLQSALIRLLRSLEAVRPESVRDFLALSAQQIRRELLDLARHYFGPQGVGANHATNGAAGSSDGPPPAVDLTHDPCVLAAWCEFHRHIEELPVEEREVVSLLFYQGLTQAEAAGVLGVTVRTVQRRWQAALVRLHPILKGQWPGL